MLSPYSLALAAAALLTLAPCHSLAAPTTTTSKHALTASTTTTATAKPTCYRSIKLICARGTGAPQDFCELNGVAEAVASALPQYHPYVRDVVYPAVTANPPYKTSVGDGARDAQIRIRTAVDHCPDIDIVLLGYSQGGQVMLDAAFGSIVYWNTTQPLPYKYQQRIKAIVVMGDPTHYLPQTFVHGTANGSGILPRNHNYECDPLTNTIASFCDAGDPYCSHGNDVGVHLTYLDRYTNNATAFILAKLAAAGKKASGSIS